MEIMKKNIESDEEFGSVDSDEEFKSVDSDEEFESDEDNEQTDIVNEFISDERTIEFSPNRWICFVFRTTLLHLMSYIVFSDKNRIINQDRIKNGFKNFDPEKCDPIILGFSDNEKDFEKNKLYIIDGQHRLHLLFENKDNYDINDTFIIDLRRLKDENDFRETLNIANNRLNFSDNQLNKYKLRDIYDLLVECFGKENFGKNRPKVNWEKMLKKLVNHSIYKEFTNDAQYVVERLIELNRILATKSYDKVEKKLMNITDKMLIKCSKNNFFLGIDKEYRILDLIKS